MGEGYKQILGLICLGFLAGLLWAPIEYVLCKFHILTCVVIYGY